MKEITLRRDRCGPWTTRLNDLFVPKLASSVTTLNVIEFFFGEDHMTNIDVSPFRNLQRLSVVASSGKPVLVSNLQRLDRLTELRLCHNYVSKVQDWLKYMKTLQLLHLRIPGDASEKVSALPGLAASSGTLRKLYIEFFNALPPKFFEEASSCFGLTSLRVYVSKRKRSATESCSVTDFKSLSKLVNLRKLSIYSINISDTHLRSIIPISSQLISLTIDRSHVLGAQGLEVIATHFSGIKNLSLIQSTIPSDWPSFISRLVNLTELRVDPARLKDSISKDLLDSMNLSVVIKTKAKEGKRRPIDNFRIQNPRLSGQTIQDILFTRKRLQMGLKKCTYCGSFESENRRHFRCGKCKQAFYCNLTCQTYDWSVHKNVCQHPKTASVST